MNERKMPRFVGRLRQRIGDRLEKGPYNGSYERRDFNEKLGIIEFVFGSLAFAPEAVIYALSLHSPFEIIAKGLIIANPILMFDGLRRTLKTLRFDDFYDNSWPL